MVSVDLRANYERLFEIVGDLRTIRQRFADVDDRCDFSTDDFGDGELLAAVRKFSDGWRDGRARLDESLESMAGDLDKYAVECERYDSSFNQGASVPGSATSPETPQPMAPGAVGVPDRSGGTHKPPGTSTPRPRLFDDGVGENDDARLWSLPVPPPVSGRDFGTRVVKEIIDGGDQRAEPPGSGSTLRPNPGMELIDRRLEELSDELRWVERDLEAGSGTTETLLERRQTLLAERDRLERIDSLLVAPELPQALAPNGEAPGCVTPLLIDASNEGVVAVAVTPLDNASQVVMHVESPGGGWGAVLEGDRLGSLTAWELASGATGVTAVISYEEPGAGGAHRLGTVAGEAAARGPLSIVAEDASAESVREVIRSGAPIDNVAVLDGSPRTVADLNARGVNAVAIERGSDGWWEALRRWLNLDQGDN